MSKKKKTVNRGWQRRHIARVAADLLKRDKQIVVMMEMLHQLRDDIASVQWALERIARRYNKPTPYEDGDTND